MANIDALTQKGFRAIPQLQLIIYASHIMTS